MTDLSLTDVADIRAGVYGVLGALFHSPTPERLRVVGLEADSLRTQVELGPGFPFDRSLHGLLDVLEGPDAGLAAALAAEHAVVFTPAGGEDACLPHEWRHIDGGLTQGVVAARVEQAYAESGLSVSTAVGGELPDHVALELEFMSVLCAKESASWTRERTDDGAAWLRRQQAFLDAHLGRWLPRFTRCVLRKAAAGSAYRLLAEAAQAFVVHDRDLIGVLLRAEEGPPA